jgi:hypothetical protein
VERRRYSRRNRNSTGRAATAWSGTRVADEFWRSRGHKGSRPARPAGEALSMRKLKLNLRAETFDSGVLDHSYGPVKA